MRAPPVVHLALAYAAGVGWVTLGAPLWTAPATLLLYLAAPIRVSARPGRWVWAAVATVAALNATRAEATGCASPAPGSRAVVEGRFHVGPRTGAAPFELLGGCGPVTVVTSDSSAVAGVRLRVEGRWMAGRHRPWLRADTVHPVDGSASAWTEARWAPVRWRDGLVRRIDRLYGPRGPVVSALTLARREGMDRSLSDAFARTGIAHLLAISGFHVGLLAGAALALLRLAGLDRRRAHVGAAGTAWLYVGLIGFPAAACRAALILACVALGRARGRPPARWSALPVAALILLVLEPSRLGEPGFQLSFAGAAGLVAWSGALTRALQRGVGRRLPRSLVTAVAAGAAATLSTLPIVAWHFERVSLVGIPVTLVATPLVAVALPGAILSVLLDMVSPTAALFLAGGVDVHLAALEGLTTFVASWDGASRWTSRTSVVAGCAGVVVAAWIARHPRIGGRTRRGLVAAYLGVGLVGWPLLSRVAGFGTVEVVMIDVGQGDAFALRSPRGRWLLVDAGPPGRPGEDAGGHPVLRALRDRGVSELSALVLTHPDLDHIGGAAAVVSTVRVGAVYDPGVPAGKEDYLHLLETAAAHDIPWRAARAGEAIPFDGAELRVLHPDGAALEAGETNETSVVLLLSYGEFDVLLTGDAYKPTERRLAPDLADIEILKVGHHGSDTSTDSLLLASAAPEAALVSVGRFNRYGHPTPAVLGRLDRVGARVLRTDRSGAVTVRGRADGSFTVRTER